MKKLTTLLLTVLLLAIASPVFAVDSRTPRTPTPQEVNEARILINRIGEIEKMDKSSLDPVEKSELREEVKGIQKQLKTLNNGGVYVSVGAIIIIILLLIILL